MGVDVWADRLRGIVGGEATSAQIEGWIDAAWRGGRFMAVVPAELLRRLPASGHPVSRYGDANHLRTEVCFRHPHGPGGVVVRTPAMEPWSRARGNYCVPPHVHRNPHLTVILEGESRFFVARSEDRRSGVVQVAARPGHVLLCPADVAHTFGSSGGAFTVLSIHARFVDPSRRDFARRTAVFDELPAAPGAAALAR
jgi:hypothetical protein